MRRLLLATTVALASCAGSSAAPSPIATPTPQAQVLTVNAGGGASSLPLAWNFQVKYSSRYLVTDDWMLTAPTSQGGIAPPRLAFTLGSQLMALDASAYDLLRTGDQDCILIWSTLGFHSIADWEGLVRPGEAGTVVSERTQQVGSFTFVVREMAFAATPSHSFEAFLQLPQNLSYFFNTCNANSQADLSTMLQTFHVRV